MTAAILCAAVCVLAARLARRELIRARLLARLARLDRIE